MHLPAFKQLQTGKSQTLEEQLHAKDNESNPECPEARPSNFAAFKSLMTGRARKATNETDGARATPDVRSHARSDSRRHSCKVDYYCIMALYMRIST